MNTFLATLTMFAAVVGLLTWLAIGRSGRSQALRPGSGGCSGACGGPCRRHADPVDNGG